MVASHCVWALMSFFTPALTGGSVDFTLVFERATTLARSGVLLHLLRVIQALVSDAVIIFNLHGSQFDYGQTYQACYCSLEVDWDDEA